MRESKKNSHIYSRLLGAITNMYNIVYSVIRRVCITCRRETALRYDVKFSRRHERNLQADYTVYIPSI